MWLIELGFRNHFILKRYRFLTTAIFNGSALIVHKPFKNNVLTLKALGFFLPVQHWGGGVFHSLCKIRSRHLRKLKFTGLIAYVMFYEICKFESLTTINDVIMTSLPKTMGKCGNLH